MNKGRHETENANLSVMFRVLRLLFILGAIWFAWKIISTQIAYQQARKGYEQIQQITVTLTESEKEMTKKIDWLQLKKIAPDAVAWISCEGAGIDYPVVQASDNAYYMHRLSDGSSNFAGSIFMDYRSTNNFSDLHSVLYGHNMKNGSMFGGLFQYADVEFYEKNPEMQLYLPNKALRLEILAAYVEQVDDGYDMQLSFEDNASVGNYIKDAIERSNFKTKSEYQQGDKLVTLVSCTPSGSEKERFFVLGCLKES